MTAHRQRIDFEGINRAAVANGLLVLGRWLPNGRVQAGEFVALNPRRHDRKLGSFRININSGAWADFALSGVSGGDFVSLGAYLFDMSQVEAAEGLARMLGVPVHV
jgi:hypothetical protein